MSEQEVGFPATEESTGGSGNYMTAGMHRMKISSMTEWLDKNKQPKIDKRGYKGLYITFINEQGQTISDGFYYSKEPLNSPKRSDDNLKCKSEYFLTNLKTSLGFGKEPVSSAELKAPWCWGAVGVDILIDGNKKPTGKKFSFLVKKWFPDGVKPILAGDPDLSQSNGIPSGMFLKNSTDRNQATATQAVPERTASQSAVVEQKEDSAKEDDMPIDDF